MCVCCKRLRNVKRVFAREKEKSCQTDERRILDGSKSRKAKKKTSATKKKQTAAAQKCVKNGRVGYFVLFLSICGLKWLLFFEHNLYYL